MALLTTLRTCLPFFLFNYSADVLTSVTQFLNAPAKPWFHRTRIHPLNSARQLLLPPCFSEKECDILLEPHYFKLYHSIRYRSTGSHVLFSLWDKRGLLQATANSTTSTETSQQRAVDSLNASEYPWRRTGEKPYNRQKKKKLFT